MFRITVQHCVSSLCSPGGEYWHTYVAQLHFVETAQPSFVVVFHTTWVKCPVDGDQPGVLKLYLDTCTQQQVRPLTSKIKHQGGVAATALSYQDQKLVLI